MKVNLTGFILMGVATFFEIIHVGSIAITVAVAAFLSGMYFGLLFKSEPHNTPTQ